MFKTGWVITWLPGTSIYIVRSFWDGVYNMVPSGWNLRETQRHQRHPIASVPRLWWGIIRKSRTCRWPQDFFGVVTQGNSKDCPLQTSIAMSWKDYGGSYEMTGILSTHVMWWSQIVWLKFQQLLCVFSVGSKKAWSEDMKQLTNQSLRTSIEELQQFLGAEGSERRKVYR